MQQEQMQVDFLRWDEKKMLSAMQRITDVLCLLAKAYIEAGLDSVYYASLGGEYEFFTDEEFAKWIKPFDIQVMKAIKEAGGYCFLHSVRITEYGALQRLCSVCRCCELGRI